MTLEPTMPPQFEDPWGPVCQLNLTGTEDLNSLDLFNTFEDLNFDDTHTLFGSDLPEFEHLDLMDDLMGTWKDQVRHDCMWSGTCVEDKDRPNPLDRLLESTPKAVPTPASHGSPTKDTEAVPTPQTSVLHSSRVNSSVKCNQRSILRTNLNLAASVVSSDPLRTASQDESDDSGRPETPQSMSSDTEGTDLKHDNDLGSSFVDEEDDDDVDDEDDDEETEEEEEEEEDDDAPSTAMPVSDVTGQTVRTSLHKQQHESRGHASRFDSRPQQTVSTHFFNDHSYHLSKDVSASIPGNLTPSDSEDEIDVVSVCGEKTSSSRSSSQGALPTNPSARDRHALQQSMASAMKRSSYSPYLPGRQPSGKLARMQAERQRQRERKRRAQERDDSSEEDIVRPSKKRAKHHHVYKTARRGHHSFKSASSDSEPDSCEKRSLHNNMERQRRVDLRNAFEDLRVVVPTLSPNPRAAKVVILKEASHFCHQLTADSRSLQQESSLLERERDRLLARVSFLRKQVASMRMGM